MEILDVGILCSGPSFKRFLETPVKHDGFIGVNQAAEAWACDWWSWGDAAAFDRFEPIGRPAIFTGRGSLQYVRRRERIAEHEWRYYEDCATPCPSDLDWRGYSMTAAMVLAETLGARRIVLYGADWCGTGYFSGSGLNPEVNSAYRWGNEKHHYSRLKGWLASRGVVVERVLAAGFEQAVA